MARWAGLAAVVLGLFVLSGCAEGTTFQEWLNGEEEPAKPAAAKPSSTPNPEPKPAPAPEPEPAPEPAPEPSGNPLAAKVQKESREFCALFSQAELASEYGVSNNLSAVARAYASEYRSGLQANAEEGCIEGLAG
jgi:outer membrane biosynthesis protein TonB